MAVFESIGLDVAMRVLVAIGIGGLIGLERERHRGDGPVFAGVRTMPMVAVSGVLVVLLAEAARTPWLIPAAFVVFGALAVVVLIQQEQKAMATPVTFLATFLLGLVAGVGELFLAVSLGVGITFLLFYKDYLHRMADVLTEAEMRGTLYFTAVAFILYPLAPADPIDPWGIVAPQRILLIVVLVSALSFLGFLVMRRFGASRGLPLTGLLGGLVSSVAAAGAIASMKLTTSAMRRGASQGILLATTSMVGRNLAIVVLVDPSLTLARLLAIPLLGMMLALVIGVTARVQQKGTDDETSEAPLDVIRNPFALRPALEFGLIFLGLSVAAFVLRQIPGLGDWGIYLTALGGLVSSGAVLASMALLVAQGDLEPVVAASVGLLSVVLSLGVKAGIARKAGPAVFRMSMVWLALAMAAGVGAAAALL